MSAADLTAGDRLTAEDVTTADVARLLDWLALGEVGGRTYVPTWDVRRVLAGEAPVGGTP